MHDDRHKNDYRKSGWSRRQFLKRLASAGAFSLAGGGLLPRSANGGWVPREPPRPRVPNPFVNGSGKPLLVAVEGTEFQAMLQAGMDALGGWGRLLNGWCQRRKACPATDMSTCAPIFKKTPLF